MDCDMKKLSVAGIASDEFFQSDDLVFLAEIPWHLAGH